MRLAGPPQNFLLPRPFLCFSVSSVRFSSSFFFAQKQGPGRMWIGVDRLRKWLGHWKLIHFGHTVFAMVPLPSFVGRLFFWLFAFVHCLSHGNSPWPSTGGGGRGFQDQAKDFSWNSKILCIWKIWNPVMLLISLHSNSSCGSPAYWGHFGSISAWVTTSNCKFSKC